MPVPTTRRALPLPLGTDNVSELRLSITAAANAADTDAIYLSGTLAARASLSGLVAGTFYYVTDTTPPVLTEYNGTAWSTYMPQMQYVTMSTSGTAVNGQIVSATAGITVTLPSPTLNAMVAIVASATATEASPVTVSYYYGSGAFYGPGMAGASNFKLGSGNAFVWLVCDGENWTVISGQQDTGWINAGFASGYGAAAGWPAPAYRIVGDVVRLRGAAENTSGGAISNANPIITSLPAPADHVAPPCTIIQAITGRLDIPAGGTSAAFFSTSTALAAAAIVLFDGSSYPLT